MPRSVYGGRALLNLPGHHGTAAIVAEIENTKNWPDGRSRHGAELDRYNAVPETTFEITDCQNRVRIEFDVDTENSLENSLHKVDRMIETLQAFREGLVAEGERTIKRVGQIPADRRYGL